MKKTRAQSHRHTENYDDKAILLLDYHSSVELKKVIRKVVYDYAQKGFDLARMYTEGSAIHLEFKRK